MENRAKTTHVPLETIKNTISKARGKTTHWTAHYHNWWYLTQYTGGIVYKCDCGAIKEPRAWWKFWQPRYIIKNPYGKSGL